MIGAFLSVLLALQASDSPAIQHVHAGVAAEKSGQLDAALAEFRKATELDPNLAAAFADLGANAKDVEADVDAVNNRTLIGILRDEVLAEKAKRVQRRRRRCA